MTGAPAHWRLHNTRDMDAELWATIRRLFEVEKLSKKRIAERLGVHRWTVRRALACQDGPPRDLPRRPEGPGKLEAFKGYLESRIRDFPELSAVKLLAEIKKQSYGGGITIVKDYLQTIRPKRTREVFLRIETPPGDFGQVDWFNTDSVIIGNTRRKLSCFVMVLGYSRMIYLEFTLSQCLEDFIQCHINAFSFFGGIPKRCLYDNLKSVCLYRSGSLIQLNERFMEFAGAMGFEPLLCNPARGNEKGKVESGGKYVKGNFLPGRHIILWPDIQEEAGSWRDETANQRIHATTREVPAIRFERERPCLLPLPAKPYDVSIVRSAKATSQALIHFDANRYSVPHAYAYKTLTIKAAKGEVKIWEGPRLVAAHPRSYERGVVVENPKHYEGILTLKKQALAARTRDAFLALGPLAHRYLEGLIETDLNIPHHLAKIMECVYLYGRSETFSALEEAASHVACGAAYIKNIIWQKRSVRNLSDPQPVELAKKPQWTQMTVEQPDLSIYDELFEDSGEPSRG